MAIRQIQNSGRARNGAGCPHALQHVHQGVAQGAGLVTLFGLRLVGCPAVREVDVLHGKKCASLLEGLKGCVSTTYAMHFIADIP
mgnify:CR=1 FL=1